MQIADGQRRQMTDWGKDEMNLVEVPFGPITPDGSKTLEVDHPVFDPLLRRVVHRKTRITGSDAFGLPRPVDDRVLVGMKALTCDAGFRSPRVCFTAYELCRIVGWRPDGRAYRRIEDSLNRIAGTTLQFKDAWYDQGDQEFKSKTFHLIDEVELRTRSLIDRSRLTQARELPVSHFVWNQVIWKSFQDGFIRSLNMKMFRRIAAGRRRDVSIRLFRILDKRFYKKGTVRFQVESLAVGRLGLSASYSPSQMRRVIDRAANWLIECGYLEDFCYCAMAGIHSGGVVFRKKRKPRRTGVRCPSAQALRHERPARDTKELPPTAESVWIAKRSEAELAAIEDRAINMGFGTAFERNMIQESRRAGTPIAASGAVRRGYVKRFFESTNGVDVESQATVIGR